MKMKKIAAVLTALSVLSGCAGNAETEETTTTGTTKVTTAEAVTEETTTTTKMIEMTTINTSKSSERSSGKTKATWGDLAPPDKTVDITSIPEKTEMLPHIELDTLIQETKYTEFESVAMLLRTEFGTNKVAGSTISIYFRSVETENPEEGRIEGWGSYPSAFAKILNEDFENSIIDLTNSKVEVLYKYIDMGKPVAVWVTEGLVEPELFAEYEGNKMYNPKECVVLAGYSDTAVCVWSVIEGKYVTYDRALFEQRYAEMGSMALTVVAE